MVGTNEFVHGNVPNLCTFRSVGKIKQNWDDLELISGTDRETSQKQDRR